MSSLVLGLDFGTTNSVMAVMSEDCLEVLDNDIGSKKTPSVVHIDPTHPWRRQVGEAALRMRISDPENTIRNVKRVLGIPPECAREGNLSNFLKPIKVVNSDNGDAVSLKLSDGAVLAPEEVVAMLFLELKKAAKHQLMNKVPTKVVIAVPAFFTAAQRRAITNAASLADLPAVEIVNETTAAAAAYAFDREYNKTVLMVDVGGGGGCVSVVRVEGNELTVMACSSRLPGGENFDKRMVDYLKKAISKEHNKEVLEQRTLEILRSHWVEAKRKLAALPEAVIQTHLPEFKADFRRVVTCAEFDTECEKLYSIITAAISTTLKKAKVDLEKLDDVVLVGGSSRLKKLRDHIKINVGDKLCKALNPDEAVAQGAALLGSRNIIVKKEVLGLNTTFKIFCKDPNKEFFAEEESNSTFLPIRLTNLRTHLITAGLNEFLSTAELEVGQESSTGNYVTICKMPVPKKLKSILIDEKGHLMFEFYLRGKNVKSPYLRGCVPEDYLQKLKNDMQSQVESALEEAERVGAKNALEDVLRTGKSVQISEDTLFPDDHQNFVDTCLKHLDWLNENASVSKLEYEHLRLDVENSKRLLEDKCDLEKRRIRARNELKLELDTPLDLEVSEDDLRRRASDLKEKLLKELEWLSKNQEHTLEEYMNRKQRIIKDKNSLADECKRAEFEKQRAAAYCELQNKAVKIQMRADEKEKGNDLDKTFSNDLKKIWMEADNFLQTKKAASGAVIKQFSNQTDKSLADAEKKYEQLKNQRESERLKSLKRAENAVLSGVHLQMDEYEVVPEAAVLFKNTANRLLEWLQKNPHEDSAANNKVFDEMTQAFETLKSKLAVANTRKEIETQLQNIQMKAEESLQKPVKDCLFWLQNLQAERQKMVKFLECASAAQEKIEEACKHANFFKTAQLEAESIMTCLAKDLQLSAGHSEEAMCIDGEYRPSEYSDEPMDTSSVEATGPAQPHDHAPAPASVQQAVGAAWARAGATLPGPALTLLDDAAVLECLSKVTAVQVLKDAARAGDMALLVSKVSAGGRAFVSLAVRYVEEPGQPLERLIIVRELGRDGEDCKHLLFTPFLTLCREASVDWREHLMGVSIVGAGEEGKAFMTALREAASPKDLPLLDCGAVRLDSRLVEHINQRSKGASGFGSSNLNEFFSIIDALRNMFPEDGRWFKSLQEHCRSLQHGTNPWLTYTSAVHFVSAERTRGLPKLLAACQVDPTLRFAAEKIRGKIYEKDFIDCLETCDRVLKLVKGFDDFSVSFKDESTSLLNYLESAFKCNFPAQKKPSGGMRSDVVTNNQIREILEDLTRSSLQECEEDWKRFVFPLLHALSDPIKLKKTPKPCTRSQQRNNGSRLMLELDRFCYQFPDKLYSLADMVHGLSRTSFSREFPTLSESVFRALTAPLLPPQGPRAQEQLRAGVLRAAGDPGLVGPTTIIMSTAHPPLEDSRVNIILKQTEDRLLQPM